MAAPGGGSSGEGALAPPQLTWLSWHPAVGLFAGVMLVLADFRFFNLDGNEAILYNLYLGALISYLIIVFRYLRKLQIYAECAHKKIAELANQADSTRARLETSAQLNLSQYLNSGFVEIKDIRKGDNRMVLILEPHPQIRIGSRLVLRDVDNTPIGQFEVDQERPTSWLASSLPGIDAMWLGKMLSENQPQLPAHAAAFIVSEETFHE